MLQGTGVAPGVGEGVAPKVGAGVPDAVVGMSKGGRGSATWHGMLMSS